jgi:hypothetical protein
MNGKPVLLENVENFLTLWAEKHEAAGTLDSDLHVTLLYFIAAINELYENREKNK